MVEAVRSRYEAIGGSSPLLSTTLSQSSLLAKHCGLPCRVATRFSTPSMEEVLGNIARENTLRDLVVVCGAPFRERVYYDDLREAESAVLARGLVVPTLHQAPSWADHPAYVQGLANATQRVLEGMRGNSRVVLVLTAHSLPLRVVEEGDPYPQCVARTAALLVERLGGNAPPALVAYQSQGIPTEPWLGPDLSSALDQARSMHADEVVVVPMGFPAEHLETLFDLDIEAKRMAEKRGLRFSRVPCLDTDELLIDGMGAVVEMVSPRPRRPMQ